MKKLLPFLVSFGFLLAFSSQRSNAQVSYNMCSGGTMVTLTDTAGNFYDSGGPTGNYQNSELCTLLVAPSCGTSVTLTFTAIDLEINYDSIYVYNGSTVTAPLLAALSGSTLPAPITANSGQMLIRFKSDASVVYTGWAAAWTSTYVIPTPPVAGFSMSTSTPPLNAGVNFTDMSTGTPTAWSWDFGDGNNANVQNPTHAYAAPGTYNIQLITYVCTASDTAYGTVTVQSAPSVIVYPDTLSATVQCGDSAVFQVVVKNLTGGDLVYNTDGSANSSVRMLAMKYGADLFSEYPATINAINTYFTNYTLTETTSSNPAVIANLLVGKNVLLIPEQETGDPAVFANLQYTFNNFLLGGGTIIQCGAYLGQDSTITASGLWSGNYVTDASVPTSNILTIDSVGHPLVQGISGTTMPPSSATYVMNFTNPDKRKIVSFQGNDVVSYRHIHGGKAIFLAFDYWSSNNQSKQIIANAVQWGGQSGLPSWITMSQNTDTVAAADSSILTVVFHASGIPAGTYYGIIGISTNDPNYPLVTVACTMTVVGDPIIALSGLTSNCLNFGTITQFTSSQQTFNIVNDGCDSLIISNMFSSLPEFTVSSPINVILPGASAPVTVTFSSNVVGTYNGSIFIQNNDIDTVICVTGAAGPAPILTTTATVSQTVPACGNTDSITWVIYNTGGSDLTLTITGTPAWATLSVTGGTILAGDSLIITVTMNSGTYSGGPLTANLSIASNDPQSPLQVVQLVMNVGFEPCINIGGSISSCTGIGTFTTNNLINPPTNWTWYFGDGDSAMVQNPLHQYTGSQGTTYNVMAVGCNGAGCDTAYLTLTMPLVTGPAPAQCLPQTLDPTTGGNLGIGITRVILGNINNPSNNSIDGYENFTCSDTTSLAEAGAYSISITTGFTYEESVKAWIDFNNNGIFEPSEIIYSDSAVFTFHNGTVNIPINLPVLNTAIRMRVGSEYSGNASPNGCDDVQYGQYEDYTVFLKLGVGVQDINAAGVAFTVYPNPSNDHATIDYYLQENKQVTVEVFDAIGKQVTVFAQNEVQQTGRHTYQFNETMPGVYFIKITADGVTSTQRLVIMN